MTDHIISPDGDPFGRNNSLVDVDKAVLMDRVDVVLLEETSAGPVVGLALGGRINKKQIRADQLYLFNADGIASIVTELLALADRAGKDYSALVQHRISARWNQMPKPHPNGDGGDQQ